MFTYLAEMTLDGKLLELLYFLMGLIALNVGIKNLRDEKNPHRVGTFIFWASLALIFMIGRFLYQNFSWGAMANGVLVLVMAAPSIFKKMGIGTNVSPSKEETQERFKKIGMKIFIPALCISVFTLAFSLSGLMSSLVAIGFGVTVGVIVLMFYDRRNTLPMFLSDSCRQLELVGDLGLLPMLLAALGSIFTTAGVGDIISKYISAVVPQGNLTVGIILYCLAMPLFTMVMGNAFAAITVITVGIGAPFVLANGADPSVVGMLALTCGYCGTLCTPMAANFNIVPAAILEMKDKYGVIKVQIIPAILILAFQIVYMLIAA